MEAGPNHDGSAAARGSRAEAGDEAEALLRLNERGWHPLAYEGWFRLNPFQALLRHREHTAAMAAVQRWIDPSHAVLELGSGTGLYTLGLSRACRRVVAVDSSTDMLGFLSRRLGRAQVSNASLVRGSLGADLELGERFDGVVTIGLLNYVPDLDRALQTIAEHLKPGGWGVLSVPLANINGRLYQLGERLSGRRVWTYSPEVFAERAARAGLQVERAQAAGVSRRGLTLVNEVRREPL